LPRRDPSIGLIKHSPPLSWIPAGALPSSGDVTLTRRKHAPIGPAGQGFAMNESRHWMSAFVATGFVGITLQGHADDGGKPRGEPPQDGSISKTVLRAGQEGENLLKPTAWRALEEGYRGEGTAFCCDNGANARGRRGVLQRVVLNQQTAAWFKSWVFQVTVRTVPMPRPWGFVLSSDR